MEFATKDNLLLATVRIEPPYPATTISGKTWMAVNMSGDDGLGGISSYTWNNDWGTQYYYTLSAAKRIAASMYPGWHVPTKDEWNDLSAALYLTYINPGFPPEDVHTRPGTAVGDVMRGQEGWARAKTAYTDINVFSALPVDNYWYTTKGWTYPSAYSGESYFIADDPTANSALHYTVENMYNSTQTRLSAQYRPFEGTIYDESSEKYIGAEMNSVRLVLDSTAQNTGRPVIDKIYCVIEQPPELGEIQIGNQIWASKNMAVNDLGDGIKAMNPMDSSALYNTAVKNLSSQYNTEYYYTLDAAKRVAAAKYPGWHVPTTKDWNTLMEYLSANSGSNVGYYLRTPAGSNGWMAGAGNNLANFSAIPNDSLWRESTASNYLDPWYVGYKAYYWADEAPLWLPGYSGIFYMSYDGNSPTGAQLYYIYPSDAYELQRNMLNVRLIKNS